VITAVYNGDCDAGATFDDARDNVEEDFPDVKDVVVVLATTADIPNDSVSFVKDFPEDLRQQIVDALLAYSATDEGKEVLNTLYDIDALRASDDSFYDGFRADLSKAGLDIESLAE
jgi:phosphonate transport system substrate-binding protein